MENKMHPVQHHLSLVDLVPLSVIFAAWTDIVPSIAAVFAIGWYCILMWESDTVRKLTGREEIWEDDDDNDDVTGVGA